MLTDNDKGRVFGRLTVIGSAAKSKHGHPTVRCVCECGNEKIILSRSLETGKTKSCGCLRSELHSDRMASRNLTHGMTRTPTHMTWQSMLARCLTKTHHAYHYYGGRGISVCSRWLNFENFLNDMGIRPDGKSLDRINPNLGYEKSNCRWATAKEQGKTKRSNVLITHQGVTKIMKDWEIETGLPIKTRWSQGIRGDDLFLPRKLNDKYAEAALHRAREMYKTEAGLRDAA